MDDHQPQNNASIVFTKIRNLTTGQSYNILCKILEIYPWRQTKGEDLVMTLKVQDDPSDDYIFVKIFSPKAIHKDCFNLGETISICGIKHFKLDLYILDKKGSIKKIQDSNNIKKNAYNSLQHPLKCIKNLQMTEYIKFNGKLIYKQKESKNLVILGFIDYTVNPLIQLTKNKAYYTNNMVLYVKTWDNISKVAVSLVINSFYNLENLKVKVDVSKISADLSDSPLSKITEITDINVIKEIKARSNFLADKVISFSENVYSSIELKLINEIKKPGYYKIQVKILRHHPFQGYYIDVCIKCKKAQEESLFKCECNSPPERFFVVKYLVRDDSGEFVLLAKNEVARAMLSRFETSKKIELLVYCNFIDQCIHLEIKDLPNYI